MSDHKNHNDPLEQLFKKKAEEYDISFREEDWNSLAHSLDNQDAHIAYRRKMTLLAAASFLIVALLGYFTLDNHNRLNQLNDQLSNEIPGPPLSPDALPSIIDENESQGTGSAEHNADTVKPKESVPEVLTHSTITVELSEDESKNVQILPATQTIPADLLTGEVRTPAFSTIFNDLDSSPGATTPITDSSQLGSSALDMEPHSQLGTRVLSRISVGLLASPDLSTVGLLTNFERAGYKLGAIVEYSVNTNFSVSAGLVQTKVNYSAHNEHYHTPVYWQEGISPDKFYAECLFFDIPVTLKYNMVNLNRSRFFVTAGLSSYIMQNEDYYFSYRENTPGQIEKWSGRTGTRHWFSNAGFSIGYELNIHPQWNVRFEPFIKVPIQEVGWGNVKLYSLGSFVSLNYRL